MSDSNPKDPLEEFFQKKSGDYNISYREEDWKSLEGRLDALDAQYAARRRRRWAAAAVLLIISLLSYFIFQNYREINSLNEQLSRQEQQQTETGPAPNGIKEDTISENETSIPDITDIEGSRVDGNTAGNSQHNDLTESITQPGEELAAKSTTEHIRPEARIVADLVAISDFTCKGCELSQTTDYQSSELATKQISETYASHTSPNISLADQEDSQDGNSISLSEKGFSKVSLGLVFGPDMSTAGNFSNFDNPGSKIGITIDYNINSRWVVSLGAIRSKVNYKAGSGEYSPPAGYWYNGVEADLTRAACVLIDLPVNISYRFYRGKQSRLYASAGFSSYIMLNEDYRFSYSYEQPELPKRWNEDTGTKHFMSTANLSLGYEYGLSSSVSLRVEPFFRLPIREIGWGNVNLYSMGSLFSINYDLNGF